ncbi:hypothetical protein ACTWM0_17350 [Pseudomonas machongensis]|uniref:hypothetical protein n=1 Tax=Pseudomonas putida TaxID=303 RepID=UPI000F795C05|nr:hypothetical protein [Pseudomonas putida]RSC29549.1 hypothetical protein EGT09_25200 [Pseudomonas putida]
MAYARISDSAQYKDMSALAKTSDTDTEMIAKLSASHLIRQAEPNSLSLSNLTPAHLNLSRHLQEYLISWAYEEEFDNYDLDYADSLRNLDKSAVISQIEQGYEHSQNWIDSSKIGALFLSLNLTPCLDGDVVVLLMLETTDRVIWRAHDDDVVREIFLPPGYVKNTLNDVINFFSPPKNHD